MYERGTFLFQNKMSMTGSLMGYENNNDVNQAKCKKPLKPLPIVSSINSSGITTTNKTKKPRKLTRRNSCIRGHVNSLWSVWYGVLAVAFQAYIGLRYAKRFAGKSTPLYSIFRMGDFSETRERSEICWIFSLVSLTFRCNVRLHSQRTYRYLGRRMLHHQR